VISVIDYGAGNLRSVENALRAAGAGHEVVRDPARVALASKIILPGVGHFGQMMRALDQLELRGPLLERIAAGVPFLGVCLGLQALFEASQEAPEERGFAIFPGTVRKFTGRRVPHMGWNTLHRLRPSPLLESAGDQPFVYFANSYYAPVIQATSASCDYGAEFSAVIERANICAVQFHPEKSGAAGLRIIKNFAGRNFACS
jgi:imidazole glycerol phosphate synthase glutamine amidotransferase subunit